MEINTVKVSAPYCFGDDPLELKNLGRVNFVFAANGSGKTTISNALAQQPSDPTERAHWTVAPTLHAIRVFNEAYRARVLTEHVDGIFTMGEKAKDVNDDVDRLEGEKRARSRERDDLLVAIGSDGAVGDPAGLLGAIARERKLARDAVFDAHKAVDREVGAVVFEGFRNARDKFLVEALRRFSLGQTATPDLNWKSLAARAKSLTGGRPKRDLLPSIATTSLIGVADTTTLAESVTTSGAGDFSLLISRLSHEDWVSAGREHLNESEGTCPFCQQVVPVDLELKLAEYFAGGFDAALRRAAAIETEVLSKAGRLEHELVDLEVALGEDSELDLRAFEGAVSNLRTAKDLLVAQVQEKHQHPTRSVEVTDVEVLAGEVVALVDAANAEINRHNHLVSNAASERKKLVDDGWALLLSEPSAGNALKRLNGVEATKNAEIASLRGKVASSEEADARADETIGELRRSVSNTAEVAARINRLLSVMGFGRFRLEVADRVTGGYRLVRQDGTSAYESLSEGEKSFITFVYFWESLFGASTLGGDAEDVIAVIDDPISSLDSGALFIVAAYIRDAAQKAIRDDSKLRQLIVLTHNTQFHQEAAYVTRDASSANRRHFRLLKGLDGHSLLLDDGNHNKIRGSYALLWDSVVVAARHDGESELVRVGVFNIVRRIIEGYFKTVGLVKDHRRPKDLDPAEERAIYMFHIWADAGSHTIADDIDQAIDVGDTKQFLRLFKLYFDLQGHWAHFEMMIEASQGSDLLEPGQLFARP